MVALLLVFFDKTSDNRSYCMFIATVTAIVVYLSYIVANLIFITALMCILEEIKRGRNRT